MNCPTVEHLEEGYESGRSEAGGAALCGAVCGRLCRDPYGASWADRSRLVEYIDESAVLAAAANPDEEYVIVILAGEDQIGESFTSGILDDYGPGDRHPNPPLPAEDPTRGL